MIVVGFDTSTEELAIGVGRCESGVGEVLGSRDLRARRAANTKLLPELRDLLGELGLAPADVGAVVVGRGPGSFTGVRIGVAAAKGVAHGLGAPLFGVGTLDAVAQRFSAQNGLVGILGDAMRGEVYPALFRVRGGHVERLTPDTVELPDIVADRLGHEVREPIVLAGNALAKYGDRFREALGERAQFAEETLWGPSGESLLLEAFATCDFAAASDPGVMLPVYTRLSDAEEAERRRMVAGGCVPDTGVAGPQEEAR